MNPGAPIADFVEFGKRMLRSLDIDPVYPVLKRMIADFELDTAQADWLTVLYLAYYELSSAVEAFLAYPDPDLAILTDTRVLRLPTGIERRGLRGGDPMREHLAGWIGRYDGRGLFTPALELLGADRFQNNHVLDVYLRGVHFNGRWAAYKGCEVLHKVRDFPNAAPDAGHENSTGPRQGLRLFFPDVKGNGPRELNQLDRQTDTLMALCREHGLTLEVEEVETLLCDFNSLRRGRYYIGHDTDLILEHMNRSPAHVKTVVRAARAALPEEYRGELRGWEGVDRELTKLYRDTGEIGDRAGDC